MTRQAHEYVEFSPLPTLFDFEFILFVGSHRRHLPLPHCTHPRHTCNSHHTTHPANIKLTDHAPDSSVGLLRCACGVRCLMIVKMYRYSCMLGGRSTSTSPTSLRPPFLPPSLLSISKQQSKIPKTARSPLSNPIFQHI